jgi:hypothetical protein
MKLIVAFVLPEEAKENCAALGDKPGLSLACIRDGNEGRLPP